LCHSQQQLCFKVYCYLIEKLLNIFSKIFVKCCSLNVETLQRLFSVAIKWQLAEKNHSNQVPDLFDVAHTLTFKPQRYFSFNYILMILSHDV